MLLKPTEPTLMLHGRNPTRLWGITNDIRIARLAIFAFLAECIHNDSLWPRWIAQVHL